MYLGLDPLQLPNKLSHTVSFDSVSQKCLNKALIKQGWGFKNTTINLPHRSLISISLSIYNSDGNKVRSKRWNSEINRLPGLKRRHIGAHYLDMHDSLSCCESSTHNWDSLSIRESPNELIEVRSSIYRSRGLAFTQNRIFIRLFYFMILH